jgi:hypothetical protein
VTYDSEVLADVPWGYWECNEASGTTLADASGNARSLSITGTPSLAQSGPVAGAKAIAWPNSSATCYAVSSATTTSSPATLEAWVYLTATPGTATAIVACATSAGSSTQDKPLFVDTDGKVKFQVFSGATEMIASAAPLALNTWHHVVASVGAAGTKLRIDKVTVATGIKTGSYTGAQKVFIHGGGNGGGSFLFQNSRAVTIAKPAFYTAQLSDARTDAHYDAMFAGSGPSPHAGSLAATVPPAVAVLAGTYVAPTPPATYSGGLAATAPASGAALTGTYSHTGATVTGVVDVRAPAGFVMLSGTYSGTITTNTANRAGGRHRRGRALVTVEPPVVTPPDTLAVTFPQDAAIPLPAPVTVNGRPTVAPDSNRAVLYKAGGRDRIVVGDKDITFFRGVPLTVPSYTLSEPFGYDASTLNLPQINPLFEQAGTGALSWCREGAKVAYQRVFADGATVTDYRGVVLAIRSQGGQLTLDIGGQVSGPAGLRNEQPPLRWNTHDVGWWAFSSSRPFCHMTPRYGPRLGVRIPQTGGITTLGWMQQIGAMSQQGTTQRALMPTVWGGNEWRFDVKDTTTVHCTIFLDGVRAAEDLVDDVSERPNTFFGTGVTPDGMRIRNGRYPGLIQGPAAPYPMAGGASFGAGTTNADTRDGSGVSVLQIKLEWDHFLAQGDFEPGTFDAATTAAVKRLQRCVGQPRTGVMDTATWRLLWNEAATGYTLRAARIFPLVQDSRVDPWLYTSNGSIAGRNPDRVPGFLRVDRNYDFGSGVTKPRMIDWCEAQEEKYAGKNWSGTITLNGVGAFAGQWNHGDSPPASAVMSPRDIRPGMNAWLPGFDGGTLVHIAGAQVTPATGDTPASVQLSVDTLARDLLELSQVIARNRASRRNIRREWNAENRANGPSHNQITFDEDGGVLNHDRRLQGGQWNVVPIIAGQTGILERVDLLLTNRKAEFCMAIASVKFSPTKARRRFGNPFVVNSNGESWVEIRNIQDLLDNKRLLYVAGDGNQPLGYDPRRKFSDKTDANGDPIRTSAPITGRYRDDAGVPYKTPSDRNPLVWLLIWPDRDCTLQSGRLLYKSEDDAV